VKHDSAPNKVRAGMSPAAYCVHIILTSPTARKRGVSTAQQHVLRACAMVLREEDRRQLAKLGHAEALDRHCRVQAQIAPDGGDSGAISDLERRKELARQAFDDYTGEGA
jgi:hypothetical protein